jgi:ABC-type glycerol-3-phosphate transport system substrate-binding protein
MRRIAALVFALVALALVAAGCGGGGDSTGGSSSADTTSSSSESGESSGGESGSAAPTKAAFIKEADAVCSKAEVKLSEEVVAFAKENGIDIENEEEPSDDQKTEIYEQIVLPNIAGQAKELEALTPPKGDEETIEELTSTLSEEAEDADPSDLDENTFEDASKIAQEYGLHSCGA